MTFSKFNQGGKLFLKYELQFLLLSKFLRAVDIFLLKLDSLLFLMSHFSTLKKFKNSKSSFELFLTIEGYSHYLMRNLLPNFSSFL